MIQGVIFDMDGLMFDTERLAIPSWMAAGKKQDLEITEAIVYKTFGMNRVNTKKTLEEALEVPFDFEQLLADRVLYADNYIEQNGLPVKKGLYSLLTYLQENNLPFTMATSTKEPKARHYLQLAGIADRFGKIACGNMVENGKPAPDIYRLAASFLRLAPSRCIALEDSHVGITAAYAAGLKPVMVPDLLSVSGKIKPMLYRIAASLEDVIPILIEANMPL